MSEPHDATTQPCSLAWPAAISVRPVIAEANGADGDPPPSTPSADDDEPGDILYGAKAIARFLFGADGRREQRRVFNLWSHY